VNMPSVSSSVALTDIENPPRSASVAECTSRAV